MSLEGLDGTLRAELFLDLERRRRPVARTTLSQARPIGVPASVIQNSHRLPS